MNRQYLKRTLIFVYLITGLCLNLSAQETSDTADARKESISHMHHQLEDDQAPHKAKEAQALKELNEMTIRDDVRIEDVYGKIDELMSAQTQILRLRYEHLIEMRKLLSDEQKVDYDKNVLGRSAVR